GWFRIGAIHHNVRRGAADDDEHLRDFDLLRDKLRGLLNLLLHGHTHKGDWDFLEDNVPILAAGSAALKNEQLPHGLSNQYQIIQIEPNLLTRWCRAYAADLKKWIGDTRADPAGDDWKYTRKTAFAQAEEIFSAPAQAGEIPKTPDKNEFERMQDKADDFLSHIELICNLRARDKSISIKRLRGGLRDYLKICVREGNITHIYPLGAEEETLSEEIFQDFLTHVAPKYRSADPAVIPEFVYGGTALSPDSSVHELAKRERVRLYSFIEYQGLMDFRSYIQLQTERLNSDPHYPPELYVPQQMRVSRGRKDFDSEALPALLKWLDEPDGWFILILGEFGTGKTFLLRQAARQLGEQENHLIPLLLEMRSLEKSKSLDKLVAQQLAEYMPYDAKKFRYMLAQGRVALLFDGFDELALRVTYDKAADHFDTLLEAARGKFAKVAVTSRTQHFISDKQVKQKLMEKTETISKHRVAQLLRFDAGQIRQFLRNALKNEAAAKRRFTLIGRVKDLMGLSANPRMLGFIADLPEEDLQQAEQRKGQITAAGLYQLLLERWLRGEQKRVEEGFNDDLKIQDRWRAVTMLALALWERTSHTISKDELTEQVQKHLKILLDAHIATWQIGSGTLLVRDAEGNFGFIHQSVMEWLAAKAAVFLAFKSPSERQSSESLRWHAILSPLFEKKGDFINPLSRKEISPLMAEFFKDLAGHEPARDWARAVLDDAETNETVRKNAFKILDRMKEKAGLVHDS
ncbi:MAG: NACHT domain-containing protein, partial [Gammaproteobacteria bacterium]|nr:NACHT domain-containing protein [Gammaproteobacteria bacterium]